MKIAVTGGRNHIPTRNEVAEFNRLWDELGGTELLHGDCSGVDSVMALACQPGAKITPIKPNWYLYGKAAGPIRNRAMMKQADALIVFPGGRGTANCVKVAQELGKPVYFVAEPDNR